MLKKYALIFLIMLIFQFFSATSLLASYLIIKEANEGEIKGTFDLLLYGGRHGSDIETIAFLDIVDDDYEIELFTSEFNYKRELSITAKEAVQRAKKYVSWHNSFMNLTIRKIMTSKGDLIGYEIKPLYLPFEYGVTDVFDNSYWLRGKKVVISIKLLQPVERFIYDFGNSKDAN